jgi:iron complex outermembrane recepter protein
VHISRFLTSVAFLSLVSPAAAQVRSKDDAYHDQPPQEIVVTGLLSQDASKRLSGTTVLTGDDLTREIRGTIGDTLAQQPGVSSTSFGPNASRPVLRGFQGERVRLLTDGIGSIDVSNTSVDHAVIINPLIAERIEVLRGPSALLFGSSAIGGVVNVFSSRIPRKVPDEPVHFSALGTYGSAAKEKSGTASIEVPIATKFVVHLDGSYAKTGDLRTGGSLLTPALRAQAAMSGDPDIAALSTLKGRLPNSAARTWEVAGGAAYIDDNGTIGISVLHYDSLYGLPIRYSLTPGIEAEAVRLDVQQTREDLRAETILGGAFLDKLQFRAGHASYKHNEIDEDGAIGTTFLNDSIEARLELVQAQRGAWKGASGVQMSVRDFNIIGAEAFIPKNTSSQMGVFTLQELTFGEAKLEGGARYERTSINADANATIGNPETRRQFNAVSASLGASYAIAPAIRLGLNASYTQRAPSAEELFPNGPHAGTQAFEIGNPDFKKETSTGIEASLNGKGSGYSFGASLYYTHFNDYIYETQTGAVQDDLPVFQYLQGKANYLGFEVEGSIRVATFGDFALNADALADMVRAKVKGFGPVPRIPPLRVLGGLELQGDSLQARLETEWSHSQTRVTGFETPTSGFTLVNASVSFKPFGKASGTSILLSANNIFDVEARRHASFLKDYAPLSGRDVRLTARVAF